MNRACLNKKKYLDKNSGGLSSLEKPEYVNDLVEREILLCKRGDNLRRKVLEKAKDNHRLRKYITPVPSCENYLKIISKQMVKQS